MLINKRQAAARAALLALAAAALTLPLWCSTPASAQPGAEGPFYVQTTGVNLRLWPNGPVILVFDPDDKVFITERDGNWCQVSAPGRDATGWMWEAYLADARTGEAAAQPAAESSAEATAPPHEEEEAGDGQCVEVAPLSAVEDVLIEASLPLQTDSFGMGDGSSAAGGQPAAAAAVVPLSPVTITTPDELSGKCYQPVGGHDIALISGSNVNVRADSSLKSDVVGHVGTGDKVYIVCADEPWYYVSIPAKDLKGWVFGEYVNKLPRVEISGDQVRLREQPSLEGRIKAELNQGEVFYQFAQRNSWVLCAASASGLKGWVHGNYVKETERSASRPYKVTGDEVNFRASPNVDADIITKLALGTEVQVLGRNEKWSFIEHGGQQGWMYSAYLDPNFKNAPKAVYGKSIGDRLIKRAKAMEGTPYVYGGESEGGVDCSGLVYKILLEEGAGPYSMPRRASIQFKELGVPVDKEDLEPGDLVFFSTRSMTVGHVGVYLGDGNFIHASSYAGRVTIDNLSHGNYKRRYQGARRITEEELRRLK